MAETLQDWGADWINADLIARDCLNQPEILQQLSERWGDNVIAETGQANRVKIADYVFGDHPGANESLRYLESLVHPETRIQIGKRIVSAASKRTPVALLDVPLLFESGWDLSCDAVWCIHASRENRLARSGNRGWDADELDRREAKQMAIETKMRLSNCVMQNDATLESLRQNLLLQWEKLVRIVGSQGGSGPVLGGGHCQSDWPET